MSTEYNFNKEGNWRFEFHKEYEFIYIISPEDEYLKIPFSNIDNFCDCVEKIKKIRQEQISKIETKVVNVKKDTYDVFIGRPSIFGNPFKMNNESERIEVIDKYRKWLNGEMVGFRDSERQAILKELPNLKGKILGCFCYPLPCHGDVLIEMLKKI